MTVVIVDARVVTALVEDPLFFAGSKLSLELPVVLADHALEWIIVAVPKVIGSLRDSLRSLNVVRDQSQAIWTETLEDFSVETSVLLGRVGPVLVFELEVVIEEVVAFNELTFVPLGDVTALVKYRLGILSCASINVSDGGPFHAIKSFYLHRWDR